MGGHQRPSRNGRFAPESGQIQGSSERASKRMLIAKRIIRMAQRGVVERDQLCASVAQTTILGVSALDCA
jgi:hypothetical protein